eukprot:12695426-Prorocentrum_lima.AAC.1
MTSSLVGSEMCIRDSYLGAGGHHGRGNPGGRVGETGWGSWRGCPPNSAHQCCDHRPWLSAGVRIVTPSSARSDGRGRGAGSSSARQRERCA